MIGPNGTAALEDLDAALVALADAEQRREDARSRVDAAIVACVRLSVPKVVIAGRLGVSPQALSNRLAKR